MDSRQARYQEKHWKAGLCILCSEPAKSRCLCDEHLAKARERERNKYRMAHGIPLNAPLQGGRPRCQYV